MATERTPFDSEDFSAADVAEEDEKETLQELQLSATFLHGLLYYPISRSEESDSTNDTGYGSEACRVPCQDLLTRPNKQECFVEVDGNESMTKTSIDQTITESAIPCFSGMIDQKGGILSSGDIALIVPPLAVPKSTQFSCHMLPETSVIPALTMPDSHYLMSPILSLSPHDGKFQKRVAIRFPFSAVPKGWFLRLIYCPLNGDRWEALLDVIVPQSTSSSSLMIMPYDGTLYDPDTNSIFVDHFCRQCWVGVPLYPDVKRQIWCTLFGRPLGQRGQWEIIVRCFNPYMEVYHCVAELMQNHGAEPLIEDPEPLEIGESGVVRIALEDGQLHWRLDGGPQEFETQAKCTFWKGHSESFRGYRCSFIVRPEKEADYLRVVVSVSYTDSTKKQWTSKQLVGTASLSGCSPPRITNIFESQHIVNLNCSAAAIGQNNQIIYQRFLPLPQHLESFVADTEGRFQEKENADGNSFPTVSRTDPYNSLKIVPECGQQESMCFFLFPREGKHAPRRCTIYYLGFRDATKAMTSQGTRMPDPYLIQTRKPSWPYPDTVAVLIKDEEGYAVGLGRMSLGDSQLPVTLRVTVTSVPSTGKDSEEEVEIPAPPRAITLARTHPDCCVVGISTAILVSFPDDNGVRLESENCILQYWKHHEQEPEFVTPGRRGVNKYEVEANTPCFETAGERAVHVLTERESHLIAVSKIDVSSSKDGGSQVFTADRQQLSHRRSHSVAPICEEVSDFRNKERKVISSPKETQHTTPAENVNPLDSGLCLPSELDSMSEEGQSQLLSQVGDGYVTELKTTEQERAKEMKKCTKDQIDSSEETGNRGGIISAKETTVVMPTDTGLSLPPTGKGSSEMGMKLMLGVKSGGLSQEKAIEEFRDDFNTSQASSQQPRKAQPRQKQNKLGSPRKGVGKLKLLRFARGDESTSQDEKGFGTRREKRGTKKKPASVSEKTRSRIFTVSSNETNTSEITHYSNSEDAWSICSAPEPIKEDEIGYSDKIKAESLPRNARLLGVKNPRPPSRLQDGMSLDSGVCCVSPTGTTGKGLTSISSAVDLDDEM